VEKREGEELAQKEDCRLPLAEQKKNDEKQKSGKTLAILPDWVGRFSQREIRGGGGKRKQPDKRFSFLGDPRRRRVCRAEMTLLG